MWQDKSKRRAELPSDWPQRVAAVKKRAGGRCEQRMASGKRCPRRGSDCDHRFDRDDHSLAALQWLCTYHHGQKTSREARAARRDKVAKAKPRQESHPGLRARRPPRL